MIPANLNIATFAREVHAAGLSGLPFTFGADGVFGEENLNGTQRQALQQLINAHDPQAPDPEETRQTSFANDLERQTLLQRLKTATAEQIDAYVDNQISSTNATQLRNECRAMFKRIIKVIALDARR